MLSGTLECQVFSAITILESKHRQILSKNSRAFS